MQLYKFTNNKHINKKEKELEEIRVICQRFHSSFLQNIFTWDFYSFDTNNPRCEYSSFPPHRKYLLYQVPLPLLVFLDDTWYTKGIHGYMFVYHPGVGYDTLFFIKIFFHHREIQPYIEVIFWVTGNMIVDFDKQAYKYDIILFLKKQGLFIHNSLPWVGKHTSAPDNCISLHQLVWLQGRATNLKR